MHISKSVLALSTLATFSFFTAASNGNAAVTEWAQSEGGRMRVVTLDIDSQGVLQAGLEIELRPGWITYWREPGEAGIPPHIATSTNGVSVASVLYPVPKLIMNGDMRDIGYDQSVLLPFKIGKLDPSKDSTIKLSAFIGVCQNICIPFQADFDLKVSPSSTATDEERQSIDNAHKKLPQQPDETFKVASYEYKQNNSIGFDVLMPQGADAKFEAFLTGPEGYAFTTLSNLKQTSGHAVFDMDITGLPKRFTMQGSTWRILIKAGGKAIESPLKF